MYAHPHSFLQTDVHPSARMQRLSRGTVPADEERRLPLRRAERRGLFPSPRIGGRPPELHRELGLRCGLHQHGLPHRAAPRGAAAREVGLPCQGPTDVAASKRLGDIRRILFWICACPVGRDGPGLLGPLVRGIRSRAVVAERGGLLDDRRKLGGCRLRAGAAERPGPRRYGVGRLRVAAGPLQQRLEATGRQTAARGHAPHAKTRGVEPPGEGGARRGCIYRASGAAFTTYSGRRRPVQ
mmetsp:Transcript_58694/g.182319  ORF Transcript_58694/g.182319 Transcript_58694/m.182319 type:complete len:240 (+) Transcript_58694:290-1009(+)